MAFLVDGERPSRHYRSIWQAKENSENFRTS